MKITYVDANTDEIFPEYYIVIDGITDQTSTVFQDHLYLKSDETLSKLSNLTFDKLADEFASISFSIGPKTKDWTFSISLVLRVETPEDDPKDYPYCRLYLQVDPASWKNPYSIRQLKEFFKQVVTDLKYSYKSYFTSSFSDIGGVEIHISADEELRDLIDYATKAAELINDKLIKVLPEKLAPDLLNTLFEFPEELKTACKQYLIYFAQFLGDMGIKADTAIKEEANKVLFTVVPEQGHDALIRIKEALEVYMNAPGMPEGVTILPNDEPKDIAVMQWEANIHHLKGQVMLQQAALQLKDAAIEQLKLSNYQLQERLSEPQHLTNSAPNEEKFLGGVVAVKKFEGKGFSIDFAEIIRKLRRKKS